MKTKGKRNLRLKYLLIVLLLTAILFGSSTYAWFTTNKTVTISSFDVNVVSVNGIQISADAVNWGASIDKNALVNAAYAGKINTFPVNIEPVSTVLNFDGSTGLLEMFYGTVLPDTTDSNIYKLSAAKNNPDQDNSATGNTKYVVFDMFLKTTTAIPYGNLKLTYDSGVSSTNKGIENAARIAFIIEGNGEENDTNNATTFQSYSTADRKQILLWEPNASNHTAAAVSHASSTYSKAITTTSGADANIVSYSGVAKAIGTPGVALPVTTQTAEATAGRTGADSQFLDLIPNSIADRGAEGKPEYAFIRTESFMYSGSLVQESNIDFFGLAAGVTKIRVYMWLEGQDLDCENNASGMATALTLKFTIDDSITPPTRPVTP